MTTWAEIMRRIAERLAEIILGIIGVPLAVVGWTGRVVAEAWRIARTDPDAQQQVATGQEDEAAMLRRLTRMLDAAGPEHIPTPESQRHCRADQDPEAGSARRRAQRFVPDLPAPEPEDEDDLEFGEMLPVCR